MEREKAGKEGVLWRCPRKGCRREMSLRKDTFFEGNRADYKDPSPVVHQDPFKQDEGRGRNIKNNRRGLVQFCTRRMCPILYRSPSCNRRAQCGM